MLSLSVKRQLRHTSAHSDCCFFALCANILTYLLTYVSCTTSSEAGLLFLQSSVSWNSPTPIYALFLQIQPISGSS